MQSNNPFFIQDRLLQKRRSTTLLPRSGGPRLLLEAAMVYALVFFVISLANTLSQPPNMAAARSSEHPAAAGFLLVLFVAWMISAGLTRGFMVLARERQGRRFEMVQCSPMPASDILAGLAGLALRQTLSEGFWWGLLLLLAAGAAGILNLAATAALVTYTVAFSIFLTSVGLWAAARTPASNTSSGGYIGTAFVWYCGFLIVWHIGLMMMASSLQGFTMPSAIGDALISINPLGFLYSIYAGDTGHVLWPTIVPVLFYLLASATVLWQVTVRWSRLEVETPVVPELHTATVQIGAAARVRKPAGLRDPFVADSYNRWIRVVRSRPLLPIMNLVWMYWMASVFNLLTPISSIFVFLIFMLWGMHKASQVVERERDPGRFELLVTTGMAPARMLRSQWLAGLLPLWLPVMFYIAVSLGHGARALTSPDDWLTILVPVLGIAVGAAITVVSRYRIRLVLPRQSRAG